MYKTAVMGDWESVMGFRALGIETHPVTDTEEAKLLLHRLAKEGCAVLYLTEQLAVHLTAEIAHYKDALTPAIILIPGREGSLGIGKQNLQRAIERAVGADIL